MLAEPGGKVGLGRAAVAEAHRLRHFEIVSFGPVTAAPEKSQLRPNGFPPICRRCGSPAGPEFVRRGISRAPRRRWRRTSAGPPVDRARRCCGRAGCAWSSAFFNSAQICVAIKRLYVHEGFYDVLRDRRAAIAISQGRQYRAPHGNRNDPDQPDLTLRPGNPFACHKQSGFRVEMASRGCSNYGAAGRLSGERCGLTAWLCVIRWRQFVGREERQQVSGGR